ncbi:hypothetical protein [Streptococcus sanguinis]|uniref:Uncharacterized protein n=1 Tax=Streptococcus sanguinis TaxID=1305 RepID=A0A2X3Y9H1_STRSA|nr:hypothetical protein [Streptococcus sanguinis]SQF71908.1 Uncharacterised protein [Streptococcus sanguinis]
MKTNIMLFHENGKVYYYDMETNKIAIRNIENMPSEGAEKTNKIAAKISKYTVAISLVGISIDRLYRSHTTQGINMIAVISLLSLSIYIIFLVSRFFGKKQKYIDSLEAQTIELNQKELEEMCQKVQKAIKMAIIFLLLIIAATVFSFFWFVKFSSIGLLIAGCLFLIFGSIMIPNLKIFEKRKALKEMRRKLRESADE